MTSVTVIGLNGANGTPGTQDPGLSGQAANASAGTVGAADNSATAQGGNGGEGGTQIVNGTSHTGHGGQGGDATATAAVDVALPVGSGIIVTPTATAMALGGMGGAGGPAFGGGQAHAVANATNTIADADADATAQGGAGGFSVAGSPFAPPGSPSGSAIAHAAGVANASFTAIGGMGSDVTTPLLGVAGEGGGIGPVSAMAVGGTQAEATVTATGGAGGDGQGHAPAHVAAGGGAGASVSLNNRVSGSTQDGSLVLAQIANGGTGGSSIGDSPIGNAQAGSGGAATSTLSLTDTTSASVQLNAFAHGGESGLGRFLDFHGGGAGVASSTLVGAANVLASAVATGGLSRNHAPLDGAATATASATGHGAVTADAQAGSAPEARRLHAAANATATALNLGTTGFAEAEATASGTGGGSATATATNTQDGVTAVAVTSEPAGSGSFGADSEVFTGTIGPIGEGVDENSVSVIADAGEGFDTTNVPLPPSLQAVFDSPRTSILGAANLGTGVFMSRVNPTLSHTYTQSIAWNVATASLKPSAILVAGFADINLSGAGFDKLVLNISENGATVTNKVFTTVAAATAYFTNHVLNLGAWHNNGSGTLSLKIQLSITDTNVANQGVFIDVEAGLKPPPAQFIALPAPGLPDLLADWHAVATLRQSAADHQIGVSDPDAWTPAAQAPDRAFDWHPAAAATIPIPHHHA